MATPSIDWAALRNAANEAATHAYVPYSQFRVGAAALVDDGRIISGCNVENASYGGTVCAERNAIGAAVVAGERKFTALMVYTPQDMLTPPCGICRQVIAEFFSPNAPIASCNHLHQQQNWSLGELLPAAFTPTYLANSTKVGA